jgi:plastocyanin
MLRRFVGLGAAVLLVVVAMASSTSAASGRTVRVAGDEQFVPNAKIMATLRFVPGPLSVQSGETVTWASDTPTEPHTISVVAASDVPGSVEDVFNCPICNSILAGHFPNGFDNPPVFVLNAGNPGIDAIGDSLLLAPGGSVSATISAPAGSTLHYVCAIHPWMQGTIMVR